MAALVSTIITNMKPLTPIQAADTDQDAELTRCINFAFHTVWTYSTWDWKQVVTTLTTAPGIFKYTLSGDGSWNVAHAEIMTARVISDSIGQLTRKDYAALLVDDPELTSTGTPESYCYMGIDVNNRYAPVLGFWPIPASAMEIEVVAKQQYSEVTSASTTPVPANYDIVIERLALAQYYMHADRRQQEGAALEQRAMALLENLRRQEQSIHGGMVLVAGDSHRRSSRKLYVDSSGRVRRA